VREEERKRGSEIERDTHTHTHTHTVIAGEEKKRRNEKVHPAPDFI